MTCSACGEQPKNTAKDFTKAVIEINNPETLVLFRKVVIPTSMGDETDVPAAIGKYHNVLLVYEANNHAYLYSSDGIPTLLTSEVAQDLETKIDAVADDLQTETAVRQGADELLQQQLNAKANSADLSSVATSGSYTDLTNKPTIGNATLTVQRNSTNVGTFSANATSNATIDVAVPVRTSDLTNNGSDNTSVYIEADELASVATSGNYSDLSNKPTIPVVDTTLNISSNNAISNATASTALDNMVMTDFDVSSTTSTTTVQLDGSKKNLYSGTTSTKNVVLPVASSTQAGVMNSSTYDSVISNTNNINAIMNGAVAITGLSASPSQSDLTTAWQTETGLSALINRASIYDVDNNKVWTYYTNDTTWHAASNTSQVTVSTFTNSSEGTIKGSTNTGQIFAENDGTGSVNGWDTLTNNVSTNAGNITSLQNAVAGKQGTLTAGSNITISGNTISATDTTYTAGTNVSISSGNVISATDTTYSAFNGATTSTPGSTGLVPAPTTSDSNKFLKGNGTWDVAQVNSDWNAVSGVEQILNKPSLATVATTGAYSDLIGTPTIPTVNNATLTIQQNGTSVATFTANSSTNATANITAPVITMQTTDPGEGSPLAANNFIAVYSA